MSVGRLRRCAVDSAHMAGVSEDVLSAAATATDPGPA